MADDAIRVGAGRVGDVEHDVGRVVAMDVVEQRHRGTQQLGHVDRPGVLARQLGIEARGVGDVADQPVEPLHVMLDDLHQPLA